MLKNKSIAFQTSLLVLASTTIVFIALFGYNYYISSQLVVKNLELNAKSFSESTVNRIDAVLGTIQQAGRVTADFLESTDFTKPELINFTKSVVLNSKNVYGSCVGFEPYKFKPEIKLLCDYYFKRNGKLEYNNLALETYNYVNWDWYRIPKEKNTAMWSEPYFDEGGGGIVMSTYSTPFYSYKNGEKNIAGVIATDLSLSFLRMLLAENKIFNRQYAFVISRKGTILSHPDSNLVMKESIFSLAKSKNSSELDAIGRRMTTGESGFFPYKSVISNEPCYIYIIPLSSSGWSLGVVFHESEIYADIKQLTKTVIVLGIAGIIVLLIVILSITRRISSPLKIATEAAESVAAGEILSAKEITARYTKFYLSDINISDIPNQKNEIARLFLSVNKMTVNLDSLLQQLNQTGIQVTDSAVKMADFARNVEASVLEQAASTSQVNSASKEISATSLDLARSMENISEDASSSLNVANNGMEYLNDLKEMIKTLVDISIDLSERFSLISEKTENINQVLNTITKVANQTNLLSLNAAIEAEKAGEFGSGFSVVAAEIRRLSDQTSVAALDIEEMINDMNLAVSVGFSAVNNYTSKAISSSDTILNISSNISRLISSTQDIVPKINSFNQSMQMQHQAANLITESMEQLSQVAGQTRDMVIQFNSITENLNQATSILRNEITKFRV